MPEFILDMGSPEHARSFNALDGFTRGYIEALFFTDEEQLCEESDGERDMPDVVFNTATMESRFEGGNSYGFADLAPKALAAIIADCAAFQATNRALLDEAYTRDYDDEQAGRDFWYTRNGHGIGYWDRKQLERSYKGSAESIGDWLSTAARACSGRCSYVGDDGLVYLM